MKSNVMVIIVIFSLTWITNFANAQTQVSGIISSNTTWELAKSPYIVTSNILISTGIKLTIEAGVTVKVNQGLYIKNEGILFANGTENKKITFESSSTNPAKNNWIGIKIRSTGGSSIDNSQKYISGSIFKFVRVKNAEKAIFIYNAGMYISNSEFENNTYGIEIRGTDGVVIDQSLFNNNVAGLWSEYESYSDEYVNDITNTFIKNNTFANNTIGIDLCMNQTVFDNLNIINNIIYNNNIGIDFGGGGYGPKINDVLIKHNSIFKNYSYGVMLDRVYGTSEFLDNPLNEFKLVFTENIVVDNLGSALVFEYSVAKFKIFKNIFKTVDPNTICIGTIGSPSANNHLFTQNSIFSKGKNIYLGGDSYYYSNNLTFTYNLISNSSNNEMVDIKYGSGHIFNYNNIINTSNIATHIKNETSNVINAENNHFGTIDDNKIKSMIVDYNDDFELGVVDYTPYLTSYNLVAPISPPVKVTKRAEGDKVLINWDKNKEGDCTGYKIYYGSPTGYSYSNSVDVGNVISYLLDGVNINDEIAITAYDNVHNNDNDQTDGNESWYSLSIAAPNPPINLKSESTQKQIKLTWDKSTSANVNYYHIFRGESISNLTEIGKVSASQLYFSDYSCEKNKKYYYGIKSEIPDEIVGNTSDIISDSLSTIPLKAQNLIGSNIGYHTIYLQWNKNSEPDFKGYEISRSKIDSTNKIVLVGNTIESDFTDSIGLDYFTTYKYFIVSVDSANDKSDASIFVIRTGDPFAPSEVQGFKAVGKPNLVELFWTKNTEADLWKYKLYRGKSPASLQFLADIQKANNSYRDNAVETEVMYYYAISAVDSLGLSKWDPANESPTSEIIYSHAIDIVAPRKPTIVSSTSSNKRVTFKWTKVTDSDMGIYRIYRSMNNVNFAKIDSVSKTFDTYSDLTVENFKKYYYQICAVDTNLNEGALSTVIIGEPVNITPIIQQITDITDHSISTFKVTKQMNQDVSNDPDGTIAQFKWFVNDVLVSTIKNPALEFQQGTSKVKAIIIDNDGGKDSTSFNVNIDAGYYKFIPIDNQNAGISSIGNNYVFMPEKGGKMQILTNTFTKKLFLNIEGEIQSVSSISQDTIMYLASTSKKIYSFDKKGISKWEFALGGDLQASPTIDAYRNLIYVGVSNYNIFAIERTTGKVKWSYRSTSPINQPGVIIGKDYLLMLTADGISHLFRLDDPIVDDELAPLCSLQLNVNLTTAPAIDKDGYLYVSTTGGKLMKFDFNTSTKSGQIIWQTTSSGIFKTSPVIGYDGTVYLGSSDWSVYAFNGTDGSIKWTKKLDSPISTTATINEFGILYIGTESGKMYAISDAGEILWYYDAKYTIGNATSYINGNILFSTKNGELFKVFDGQIYIPAQKSSSPGLRSASVSNDVIYEAKLPQWGTYQGNNRRSGVQAESYVYTGLSSLGKSLVRFANSPNPFTDNTEIEYALDKPSSVMIIILDLTGRMIERYDMGIRNSGSHKLLINGSTLDGGVYIYQIIVNDEVHAGKMIKK